MSLNLQKSAAAFAEAKKYMPGGVNSPVRSFGNVGSNPPFISHARGSHIFDIDGNDYVDYVGSWGPMVLGHAHPRVIDAIKKAAERGTSYGAPTELETELAKLVMKFYPSIEVIRMVNSGTEATMSALRLARGFTGREKIVKFVGCYHGHSDSLLVNAGSGAARDTISLPFNDLDALDRVFGECGEQIAAVIVEPVAGNMGLVLPSEGFLEKLRAETTKFGSMLIFDEVMCGFRVARGGAQEKYKITPDLTCLGKIIGGGLPVGAYGGREEIMRQVSPDGKVYQAGTLSGNPLAMTAGIETLSILHEDAGFFDRLELKTRRLIDGLREIFSSGGVEVQLHQAGSMFGVFFNARDVIDYETAAASDQKKFRAWFSAMLEAGIYLAPSQFETLFMSDAHSDEDIALTLDAARHAIEKMT